jgi:mRNA interferase MazF
MRRGEIWLARLGPADSDEAAGLQPVVVVSNDGANAAAERLGRGVVTVVPVATGSKAVYEFQVYLPRGETGLASNAKSRAEQVCSIDVRRLERLVGVIPVGLMGELQSALRVHLAL